MKQKLLATRLAVALIFLIHGFVTGAWVPHIPLAQQRLGTDLATFGLALLALAAGAVTAMPLAGTLIHRFGSARVTIITGILFCLAFPMPALAGTLGWFVAGLAIFGATIGAMDVAMNAQALAYEKHTAKPVMSLFHGMFSVGAMCGAGLSALVLGRLSIEAHLGGSTIIALVAIGIAALFLLPAHIDRGLAGKRFFALPSRATVGLGSLCFLALMSEGAV
ncbi:MAG: MFS transporter, partial [Aestuariivirgaceae bacterium]